MVIVLAAPSPQTQKKKGKCQQDPAISKCILKLTLINFYLEEKKEDCFEWSLKTTDTYIKPPHINNHTVRKRQRKKDNISRVNE